MKKAIDHETLEALVSDSALPEVRAGACWCGLDSGWSLQGRWPRMATCALQARICARVGRPQTVRHIQEGKV